MYASIYGYNRVDGYREHLGNVINIDYDFTEKTFELGSGKLIGYSNDDLTNGLICVINDENGNRIHAGFIKSFKKRPDENKIEISFTELKKIFDTEVLLDFSQPGNLSHNLADIFKLVIDQIISDADPFISSMTIQYSLPMEVVDTKTIANYFGEYLVVNALKFLKIYLSYYGYYLGLNYNVKSDILSIGFTKSSAIQELKITEFTHEKSTSEIKTNRVVATIKHDVKSDAPSWIPSDSSYYNSQDDNNKAEIIVDSSQELPDSTGYTPGFALKVLPSLGFVSSTQIEYQNAVNQAVRYALVSTMPDNPLSFAEAQVWCGNASQYIADTVIVVFPKDINTGEIHFIPTYIKAESIIINYYKCDQYTYTPRPNLPQVVYTLGKDNNIYSGYAPNEKRIYPIVTKIFEGSSLSEAQLNALYELVNNRYVDNITLETSSNNTLKELENYSFNTVFRVYDHNDDIKELPISEKIHKYNSGKLITKIKLGFKKMLLTEIIGETDSSGVVKKSYGANSYTNKRMDIAIANIDDEPDPEENNIWLDITP